MLESLHVKNLALIREAEVEFMPGLNVLSGETGAGKSLLLGSVDLALGKRSEPGLIGKNGDNAFVELTFTLDSESLREEVKNLGIEPDEDRLIISRRITPGRSVSRVNGETVTLANLKKFTSLLIDIHGQHDHQSLLHEENHIKVLDAFAQNRLKDAKEAYEASFQRFRGIREKIRRMGGDDEMRHRRLDFLEFQLKEIEEAQLKPGEEETLDALYENLSHSDTVRLSMNTAASVLRDDVSARLSDIMKEAEQAARYDESAKNVVTMLLDIEALTEDAVREAERIAEDAETDEELLSKTSARLEEIETLKKKYGSDIPEILSYAEGLKKEYVELFQFDQDKEQILQELEAEQQELMKKADALHVARVQSAEIFSKKMEEALKDLNFLHIVFVTEVEETRRFTASGADEVRFLISTNPGEEVRPLSRIASGGELSRIMLAIRALSADTDQIPTLIFDEIDQGISGRTAALVAGKMQTISDSHQVICISHLPQIVAAADQNYLIEKSVEDAQTVTELKALSYDDSLKEIARLSGSGEITQANLENAAELKSKSRRKS